jgi:hypothetical protein
MTSRRSLKKQKLMVSDMDVDLGADTDNQDVVSVPPSNPKHDEVKFIHPSCQVD